MVLDSGIVEIEDFSGFCGRAFEVFLRCCGI